MRIQSTGSMLVLALMLGGHAPSMRIQRAGLKTGSFIAIDSPGKYPSPDGECHATLKIASMGGFLLLIAGKSALGILRVEDVNGMAWVQGHTLVYATSPIYGVPGIYVYGCDSNKTQRIVAPRTLNKAYPSGTDFFELKCISRRKPVTVYFYYAPDVDMVDFTKFRTPAFLFQVYLDGTGFRKAESMPK